MHSTTKKYRPIAPRRMIKVSCLNIYYFAIDPTAKYIKYRTATDGRVLIDPRGNFLWISTKHSTRALPQCMQIKRLLDC